MHVPLLDLKAQYAAIRDELDAAVREVVESQAFILGPQVRACEEEAHSRAIAARRMRWASRRAPMPC